MTTPPRAETAHLLEEADASLLDLVDNVLTKGVVIDGEIVLGLAGVDLDLPPARGHPVRRGPDRGVAVSVYVYALVARAPSERLGSGMSGEALRVVTCGKLLAVVGDMSAPPAVTSTTLREHDRTIRRMTVITDAVLPLRFGSMVDGEIELARRLEPAEAALEAALVRVAGREQMTVRVYERQARGEASTRSTVRVRGSRRPRPGRSLSPRAPAGPRA